MFSYLIECFDSSILLKYWYNLFRFYRITLVLWPGFGLNQIPFSVQTPERPAKLKWSYKHTERMWKERPRNLGWHAHVIFLQHEEEHHFSLLALKVCCLSQKWQRLSGFINECVRLEAALLIFWWPQSGTLRTASCTFTRAIWEERCHIPALSRAGSTLGKGQCTESTKCNKATGCLADGISPVLRFHKNVPLRSTSHHGIWFSMISCSGTTSNKHNIRHYNHRHWS